MQSFIEWAYTIGGAWGVITAVLSYAVVHLYRAREKEHRERLREARENARLMMKLLDSASKHSRIPMSRQPSNLPLYDDRDDEPTLVTRMRHQQVQDMVLRYLENEEP